MQKQLLFFSWCALVLIFLFPQSAAAVSETFFVDASYHWQRKTSITASPIKTGANAEFYLEDAYWITLTEVQQNQLIRSFDALATEFDTVIYPKLTEFLGSEWNPGIDNDPRISILFLRMPEGTGGYFNTNDEYPRKDFPTSNEREIIYVNVLFVNSPKAKSFIAHEFQHLITFYQKNKLRNVNEDIWLNEARSEYAATYLGYDSPYSGSNLENRVASLLATPSDSLTEWQNHPKDYGQVNLFFQYLVGRYGEEIVREMMRSSKVSILSINEALTILGFADTFDAVYTDWTIVNFVNNCAVPPLLRYCYQNPDLGHGNLHITFNFEYTASETVSSEATLKDWEASWNEFTPGPPPVKTVLEIDFSTSVTDTRFRVPYVITKSNGEKIVEFITLSKTTTSPYEKGKAYVAGFGVDVVSVVVIPSGQRRVEGFTSEDPRYPYTLRGTLLEALPASFLQFVPPSYPNGSLLRAKGDTKVYVIYGQYKRWIRSPEIFRMYGHLKWENIIEVDGATINYYIESRLVRAASDTRVFEVDDSRVKHWLNMTAASFTLSGRTWESIFIMNERERDYYPEGNDIIL